MKDEWLAPIGTFQNDEDLLLLNILTVPSDITNMTVNLRAPLIINTITRKGCQLIVNNEEYSVKHKVYELIQEMKKEAE
jgi:flagellar assembly factor FliW